MPLSSQRRTRTRKRVESQDRSDADEVVSIETPTRKRRRVNVATPRQPEASAAPASKSKTESQRRRGRANPTKVSEPQSRLTQEEVDAVIRNLRKAKYEIQARIDFANEVHEVAHPEGKQAYAKIAGNGWTYYVDDLEIRIGRPPDERQQDPQPVAGPNGAAAVEKTVVHIDLGPSKLVSRQHAEIRYDEHNGLWFITVNGRNGVKVDEETLARGKTEFLHSGSVIDIAGTQIMFVTPNDHPTVHPTILAQSRVQRDGPPDDEDDEDGEQFQPPPRPQRTPTRNPLARPGSQRPSPAFKSQAPNPYGPGAYTQFANSSMPLVQNDGSADPRNSSSQSAQKASPAYPRGLMLETTEDIDYGLDSAKDLKPPHSYAQLIGMAILSNPEEKLTLSKIYDWIKERYAFYRFSGGGWQNSIRHNLSLNKCFEKIARRTDEPGKGMKWQIVPEHRDEFIKKGLNPPRKGTGHGSTGPNSPMYNGPSSVDPERRFDNAYAREFQQDSRLNNPFVKTSPASTPPVAAYPNLKLAYTPDRGSAAYAQANGVDPSSPRNPFASGISPLPFGKHRTNGLTDAAAAGTPGSLPMLGGSEPNEHLYTPLITRHAPKLAPPSTARLPSHFMPLSSPAPFWKYAAEFGSTPSWRESGQIDLGLDISPTKSAKEKAQTPDQEDRNYSEDTKTVDRELPRVQSSSPPPVEEEIGQGSPTRALSSRGRDASQPQSQPYIQPVASEMEPDQQPQQQQAPLQSRPIFAQPNHTITPTVAQEEEEEEEEGMLDLARGFQPIGSFHRNMNNAGIIRG